MAGDEVFVQPKLQGASQVQAEALAACCCFEGPLLPEGPVEELRVVVPELPTFRPGNEVRETIEIQVELALLRLLTRQVRQRVQHLVVREQKLDLRAPLLRRNDRQRQRIEVRDVERTTVGKPCETLDHGVATKESSRVHLAGHDFHVEPTCGALCFDLMLFSIQVSHRECSLIACNFNCGSFFFGWTLGKLL